MRFISLLVVGCFSALATAADTPGTRGVPVVTPSRTASIALVSSVIVVSVLLNYRHMPSAGARNVGVRSER